MLRNQLFSYLSAASIVALFAAGSGISESVFAQINQPHLQKNPTLESASGGHTVDTQANGLDSDGNGQSSDNEAVPNSSTQNKPLPLTSKIYNYLYDTSIWAYHGTVDYGSYLWWGKNPYDERDSKEIQAADLDGVNSLVCYIGRTANVLDKLFGDDDLNFLGHRLPSALDSSKLLVRITDSEMARLGLEAMQEAQIKGANGASAADINRAAVEKSGSPKNRSWCFAVSEASSPYERVMKLLARQGHFDRGHGTTWITENGNHLIHSGTGRVIAFTPTGHGAVDDYQQAARSVVALPADYIQEVFLVESRGSVLQIEPQAVAEYAKDAVGSNVSILRQEDLMEQYHSALYSLAMHVGGSAGSAGVMAAAFAAGGWMMNFGIVKSAVLGGTLGAVLPVFAPYVLNEDVYETTTPFWLPFVTLNDLSIRTMYGMSSLLHHAADGATYLDKRITAQTGYPLFSVGSLLAAAVMAKSFPLVDTMTGGFLGGAVRGAGMMFGAGTVVVGGAVYLLMATDTPKTSAIGKVVDQMNTK